MDTQNNSTGNFDDRKKNLSPEQYRVTQLKGTESPFTGKYHDFHGEGMYACAVCGELLFSSDTKFDSGSGWPSFTGPQEESAVALSHDKSHGLERTEVACKKCGAHLGHVFGDGPGTEKKRYCVNSCALDFKSKEERNDHRKDSLP